MIRLNVRPTCPLCASSAARTSATGTAGKPAPSSRLIRSRSTWVGSSAITSASASAFAFSHVLCARGLGGVQPLPLALVGLGPALVGLGPALVGLPPSSSAGVRLSLPTFGGDDVPAAAPSAEGASSAALPAARAAIFSMTFRRASSRFAFLPPDLAAALTRSSMLPPSS